MRLLKIKGFLLCFISIIGCFHNTRSQELELIGHRGARGLMPENTIPGFIKALELGVDAIELDVVISGDGKAVVSHEPWFRYDICLSPDGKDIEKGSQMDHSFYSMTYEEISKYDCGSKENKLFPEQENQPLSKPLLKDAITAVESHIRKYNYDDVLYYIDIKSKPEWDNKFQPEPEKVAQLIYAELAELDVLDRIRILTLDTRMLLAFHNIDPAIVQAYSTLPKYPDLTYNLSKLTYTPHIYAPNYKVVDDILVKEVHAKQMKIVPWTVNEYEDMVRLIRLGVDGILSDYPNHFQRLRKEDRN